MNELLPLNPLILNPMLLHEAIRRFLVWLRAIGRLPSTFPTLRSILSLFRVWAEAQGVQTIEQLTPDLFRAYQQELTFRLRRDGRPIKIGTQLAHLGTLRKWGAYLLEEDLLISNPAGGIRLPRAPRPLPRAIPDVEEAIRLIETKTGEDLLAYRDKAILELLYSTGLRRGEVARLHLSDIDLVGGYCWVREGKGRKDRVVPLGKIACQQLQVYLDAVRPVMLHGYETGALFVNHRGSALSGPAIGRMVKKAVASAKLSRAITTHSLRYAAATHMMKNGAPIRHLQEFLGHASIGTTQVYTRVTIPELKAIHAKYHPREVERPSGDGSGETGERRK